MWRVTTMGEVTWKILGTVDPDRQPAHRKTRRNTGEAEREGRRERLVER